MIKYTIYNYFFNMIFIREYNNDFFRKKVNLNCIFLITLFLFFNFFLLKKFCNPEKFLTSSETYEVNNFSEQENNTLLSKTTNRTRITSPRIIPNFKSQITLSIKEKLKDKEVVYSQNFELIHMNFDNIDEKKMIYPKFNPLNTFLINSEKIETLPKIYAKKSESEIFLKTYDLINYSHILSKDNSFNLKEMQFIYDPQKNFQKEDKSFPEEKEKNQYLSNSNVFNVKITEENVNILKGSTRKGNSQEYLEDIFSISRISNIFDVLKKLHYNEKDSIKIFKILNPLLKKNSFKGNFFLRIGIIKNSSNIEKIVRLSLYKNQQHYVTIAINDSNQYVVCDEPEKTEVLENAIKKEKFISHKILKKPTKIYDAIFQSTIAFGFNKNSTKNLITILANDINLQSNVSFDDSLETLYPIDNQKNKLDVIYIRVKFNNKIKNYYRFFSKDGTINYYDSDGKSANQFLLRKPVPNGILRSPFGSRNHPILGYIRTHKGIDWSATYGSKILAAGDGEVIKTEWSRSYGYHTVIRHAHGYMSTYSHQSGFANGIKPGAKVYQGQQIGYVGSTGLSTGPHCHFEVLVHGVKVDPITVIIPEKKILEGEELKEFKKDRDHINEILKSI